MNLLEPSSQSCSNKYNSVQPTDTIFFLFFFFSLSLSALHVMRGELFSDSFFLLLSRFLAQFSPFQKFPPADCARTQHKMQDIYLLPHPRSMARLIGQLICSYCLKTRRANYFGARLISPFPCRLWPIYVSLVVSALFAVLSSFYSESH